MLAPGQKTDIRSVSDSPFRDRATNNTLEIYKNVSLFVSPSLPLISDRLPGYVECRTTTWLRHRVLRVRRRVPSLQLTLQPVPFLLAMLHTQMRRAVLTWYRRHLHVPPAQQQRPAHQ